MKFGLFTCGYQRSTLESAFSDAKEFGYDYVELWGGYPHACVLDLKSEGVNDILALIDKYNMPVMCYTPEHNGYPYNYMMGDVKQWDRCMTYLEDSIEITRALKAPYMLFSVGHAGYEADENQVSERLKMSLRRLVRKAEESNVTLILEPLTKYETNVVYDLASLKEAMSYESSDKLITMLDLAVSHTNNEKPEDYVRTFGDKFGYLHLIDNDGCSDSHILPGDGNMPLKSIIKDLNNAGFDGYATIELVTGYLEDPSYYAKLALDRVKAML